MNKEVKEKWCAALRSGKYKQVHGVLGDKEGHCCLGVLCEIAIEDGVPIEKDIMNRIFSYDRSSAALPQSVITYAELNSDDPYVTDTEIGVEPLSVFNDRYTKTFEEIADLIENDKNL